MPYSEDKTKNFFDRFKGKNPLAGPGGWLYKKLSSISTSVYTLGLVALLYVVGTIFPQGENMDEYVKAGGRFIHIVRVFNLLNFFSSPVFVIAALILLINLAVCTYDRYPQLFSKRQYPKDFKPTHSAYLTQSLSEAHVEVRRGLRELGFTLVSKDENWVVMEKGLPYRALTWLYHAGIIVCFVGFLLTYLLAFESTVTLKPGELRTITPETTGRIQSLWKPKEGPTDFHLILEEFSTDYVETPHLDYPKDKLSRLAIGLGLKPPQYEIKDDSLSPKDWMSRVRVISDGRTAAEKVIVVNDPLRYGGYTFYQEGFEQRLKVRVNGNPLPLEVKTDEDAMVPGVTAALRFGTLRNGTLYRIDGTAGKMTPYTVVKRRLKAPEDGRKYEDALRLELDGSIAVDGNIITLADFTESSTLSYRYDPGVGILWWGGILVLAAMGLRLYGGWYMAAYTIDEPDGIVCLSLHISTKGLFSDGDKIARRLERNLTRNDIRPTPLPPAWT